MAYSSVVFPRRRSSAVRCRLAGGVLLAVAATAASAALWQSDQWALLGTLRGAAGYDSNLTLSRDGEEDFFVLANPYVTLLRRNSRTDLRINAGISATEFLNGREEQQNDLTFNAILAYPHGGDIIPLYEGQAFWSRTSEPNVYLGRRVERERWGVEGEGYLSLSGKLGLVGTGRVAWSDFREITLNENRRAEVFGGLSYEWRPRVRASLNLGYADGQSKPKQRGLEAVNSEEVYVTLQLRGEISPKVSARVFAGFGEVSYTGSYVNKYTLPVAGGDLTWGIDPRRTVVLGIYSGADYAPDGQSVNESRLNLSFTQVIIDRWQLVARASVGRAVFRREFRQRDDDFYGVGGEFAYQPSERFRVSLSAGYTDQDSTVRFNRYSRVTTTLESSYRF